MLDLLASKGAKEILQLLNDFPNLSAKEINQHLLETLTRATIYRRIKELELAGFILRESYKSKKYFLSPKGKEILEERVIKQPELTQLKRTRRTLLREIKEKEELNVASLYGAVPLSPNTISQGLVELKKMGLIEQTEMKKKGVGGLEPSENVQKLRPGRPKKKHKLTKKGEEVYYQQIQMEGEE
ncbi:MAG: hypothetical protein ACXAB2_07085 [Candidatus Hodarchaeales archaeon]|jgi:DNA-binding HxlR family transcriptional regulator